MSKIWFFGDSFAHPPDIKDLSNDKNSYWWGTKLCQKYNLTPRVMSEPGSSLTFTHEQLLRFKNLINEDDYVFIFYTTPYRMDFGKKSISILPNGMTSTGKLIPSLDPINEIADERLNKILNMYIALGLDLERHLNQQYATVNYIQHVLVPDLFEKRKPKKILEFYSFRRSQLCHSTVVHPDESLLKFLPEAMEWIKNICVEENADVQEIFSDPSHFGNPKVGDYNEKYLEYIESLL